MRLGQCRRDSATWLCSSRVQIHLRHRPHSDEGEEKSRVSAGDGRVEVVVTVGQPCECPRVVGGTLR